MICYVSIEHEKVVNDKKRRDAHLARCQEVALKLEEISQQPCLVVHLSRLSRRLLGELPIQALVISGNFTDWVDYPQGAFDELYAIIREARLPIFGICGGCQMIAMAHGAEIGPMRPLGADETDPAAQYAPGTLKEWGFSPIQVVQRDPLLEGLGDVLHVLECHYWEVKQVPEHFSVLASSAECRVQILRQDDRPVYGAQFHPEAFTDSPYDFHSILVNLEYPEGFPASRPDGRRLLENFFRIAGVSPV